MARLPVDKRVRKYRRKIRQDGAIDLLSIPPEVLLEIGRYLNLPDFEALSTTARYLHEVFIEILHKEQVSARETFIDVTLASEDDYGYHDFLLRILKREINPNYVRRFDCSQACSYPNGRFYQEGEEIDVALYIGWTSEDIKLVRKAIAQSPWLENLISSDDHIAKMLEGNEEAVLMLLVPLLKNLTLFVSPGSPVFATLLPQVFTRIARAQIVAEADSAKALERLPLRKLHTMYLNSWGETVAPIVQYMSLPSVRRGFIFVDLHHGPDHIKENLRSLKGIPKSRASVVYLKEEEIWRDVAELLVEFFAGPCVIRQFLHHPLPSDWPWGENLLAHQLTLTNVLPKDPISYYWDHCVISRDPKVDVSYTKAKSRADRFFDDSECRTVTFTRKYAQFWNAPRPHASITEYEEAIRQAAIVPSPQWMALAKWQRNLTHPEKLEDDGFMLEE